jgi:hypothetical protein
MSIGTTDSRSPVAAKRTVAIDRLGRFESVAGEGVVVRFRSTQNRRSGATAFERSKRLDGAFLSISLAGGLIVLRFGDGYSWIPDARQALQHRKP